MEPVGAQTPYGISDIGQMENVQIYCSDENVAALEASRARRASLVSCVGEF